PFRKNRPGLRIENADPERYCQLVREDEIWSVRNVYVALRTGFAVDENCESSVAGSAPHAPSFFGIVHVRSAVPNTNKLVGTVIERVVCKGFGKRLERAWIDWIGGAVTRIGRAAPSPVSIRRHHAIRGNIAAAFGRIEIWLGR